MTTNNVALPRKSILGFGFGDVAYQMTMQVQSILVVYFLYNYSGVSGSIIALVVMIAGFWDAANDPMMGAIVDRTNSKMGKARPYIFFGSIPLAIFIIALFCIPEAVSMTVKIIWISVAYIGYGTCRTLVSIPYGTMMVRLTDDRDERLRLARAKSIMGTLGVILVPLAYTLFAAGKSNEGEMIAILVVFFAILYVVFNFIVFATTKEVARPTDNIKLNPILGIKTILKNKYWKMITGASLLYGIQQQISTGVVLFYLTSKFQSPELFMPIMMITFAAMILGAVTAKKVENKVGMKKLALLGSVVAFFGCLIRVVFMDANIIVFIASYAIAQFGFAYYMLASAPFIADTVEYGELTQGVRVESLSSSSRTFADKIASTIVVAGIAWILDITGYIDAKAGGTELINIVQPELAMNALFLLSAVVPVLMALGMFFILRKFNVREDIDKLKSEKEQEAE